MKRGESEMSDDRTRVITKKKANTDDVTDLIDTKENKGQAQSKSNSSSTDDVTRFYHPGRKPVAGAAAQVAASPSSQIGMSDNPVVGWVVVINGPGKGSFRPLGYGMNTIGRGDGDRVSLGFGDEEISRHNHAVLTYDPRGRRFYIQHGDAVNLTYVNGQPVLQPVELKGTEEITLGQTSLRFVAFCGQDFDWQET